ncbi:hypothetical protein [Streptomyces sp. NPDC047097]|uniref:hypothetical protein n=1 Tax=Streptomyces sp. NPDC047097 TaxID=3155260 RepID=UPI0033FE6461
MRRAASGTSRPYPTAASWSSSGKPSSPPPADSYQYSWKHLADEHGFLTDQAIEPEADLLEAVPADEFQQVWNR